MEKHQSGGKKIYQKLPIVCNKETRPFTPKYIYIYTSIFAATKNNFPETRVKFRDLNYRNHKTQRRGCIMT